MNKLKIVTGMILHGALYGAPLGAICGAVFGVGFFFAGIVWGLPIGLGVGTCIGILLGICVGLVTILFFDPLISIRRYKTIVDALCAITSLILTAVLAQRIWGILFGDFSLSIVSLIFAVLGSLSALVFSKWLTNWYIGEYARSSPNQ